MGDVECLEFTDLTLQIQVSDFFKHDNPIRFTWNNKRRVGIRTLKRLDRIYCFSNISGFPDSHVLQYSILEDCILSDHLPT